MYILPQAFLGNFFDDCLVVAASTDQRQQSMDESDKFDTFTGQRIGHKKTVGFVIAVEAQPLTSRGVVLQQVSVDKLLGVLIPMDNQPDRSLQDKRAIDAGRDILAIVKLPIPLEEKAGLIALKTAGARYGLEIEEPTESVSHDFDQAVLQALCSQRALRCKATSMALAWKGHRLFLEMACPYQAFDMARRQLARSPLARQLLREVWEYRDAHDLWHEAGICCHLQRQCGKLGWQWESPFCVATHHDRQIDLLCPVVGWFQQELRVAIRQGLLAKITARKDLEGVCKGVNYELTVGLLHGHKLSVDNRNRLRYLW